MSNPTLVQKLRSSATVFYEYAVDGGALLREAAERIHILETALTEIRDQDPIENVFDPQWSARIASAALEVKP